MKLRIAVSALGLLLPIACVAADDGELWEVTSKMNIPGMPAGMAGMAQAPQRVCNSKNPREDATRGRDTKDCKVTDLKETGARVQLTMTCPQGRMVVDQTYNAARTEYKSTMTMTSKDGDMVINSTGRKLGTCDVQQVNKAREDKSAKIKGDMDKQIAAGQRQQADVHKQVTAQYTKTCDEAVQTMDARRFPTKESFRGVPKEVQGSCDARRVEYCKKLQTEAGFSLAARIDRQNLDAGGTLCSVQADKLQATLCGRALQGESLDFLSRHCPAELKQAGARFCPKAAQSEAWHYMARQCPADSKALFAKNCAGRQFTMLPDRKMRNMCTTLARLDDGGEDRGTAAAPAAKKASTSEQAQQVIGKGLDKLKGLFGR